MIMNYCEAREYLRQTNKLGSVLGLETIKELLRRLGNPEKELRVVHVAGTNGKGSTITFLQSILMEAGYSVGRYSSPAVFHYREIIQVNGSWIDKSSLAAIITLIKKKCDEMVHQGMAHPTSFEIETAMALLYFKEKKCQIALVECGLGGKTDATNVFDKVLCSVITTISFDHTQILGDTIQKIAGVKAGIIKKNCPVVMSCQTKEAADVIKQVADSRNAMFLLSGRPEKAEMKNFISIFDYKASNDCSYHIKLQMLGTCQEVNAATAIETALVLNNQGYHVEKYIETGLSKAIWPGRMEIVSHNPLMIIDGAHNPGAVEELGKTIDLYFTNKRITFIMGVLADKDFDREAEMIAGRGEKIITVTPHNPRSLDGRMLAKTLSRYNDNVQFAVSLEEAVRLAKETIDDNISDMILAFGSLSYLGELKSVIKTKEANS